MVWPLEAPEGVWVIRGLTVSSFALPSFLAFPLGVQGAAGLAIGRTDRDVN